MDNERSSRRGSEPASGVGSNQQRVTLKRLAKYLGLSPATVSLVLNESPVADSIPQKTKDRVIEAARQLNYRPDFAARSLRKGRSFSVGVMVSEISGGYSAGVVSGIERTLLPAGYFGLIASHEFSHEYFRRYLDLLQDRSVDGYILVNTPVTETPPAPAVLVSGPRQFTQASNIVIDHDRAAELAIDHLVQLGHERIAFFRGPDLLPDSADRWRAIEDVARRRGIQIRGDLVFQIGSDAVQGLYRLEDFYREGYLLGRKLAERRSEFTALFAFNDPSAIAAMRAFHEAGIRIPEDISVVGFDDIDSAAFHQPRLTTIRQPLEQMGATSAELLLRELRGDRVPPGQVRIEPELVIRESTGPTGDTTSDNPL